MKVWEKNKWKNKSIAPPTTTPVQFYSELFAIQIRSYPFLRRSLTTRKLIKMIRMRHTTAAPMMMGMILLL